MGELFGGRYELVDALASGGVGTVWRAWDHRDKTYCAAKVLRQSDSDSLLRFMRETTRHIDHPHVMAPRSWTGEDDRILFTMPLVRGGSVDTLLRDFGTLPLGWSIELTRQSLLALDEVHELGLVHRDVKPANLLLEQTGTGRPHLMLSDFGAAAQVGGPRLTQADSVIGTPGYLAPEQLLGADPAPSQDVYAVGVVLLQMLTGVPPARDGALAPAPRFDPTSTGLADLATRLTSPMPGDRPASVADALELLDALPRAHELQLGGDPDSPVKILDHVPDLPTGWTEQGPEPDSDEHLPPRAVRAPARLQTGPLAPAPGADSSPVTMRLQRSSALPAVKAPRAGRVPPAAVALAVLGVLLILVAVLVG